MRTPTKKELEEASGKKLSNADYMYIVDTFDPTILYCDFGAHYMSETLDEYNRLVAPLSVMRYEGLNEELLEATLKRCIRDYVQFYEIAPKEFRDVMHAYAVELNDMSILF